MTVQPGEPPLNSANAGILFQGFKVEKKANENNDMLEDAHAVVETPVCAHVIVQNMHQVGSECPKKQCSRMEKQKRGVEPEHGQTIKMYGGHIDQELIKIEYGERKNKHRLGEGKIGIHKALVLNYEIIERERNAYRKCRKQPSAEVRSQDMVIESDYDADV
jgi:hypothetical protein